MPAGDFHVDSDIRFATVPPAALYLEDGWFRLVTERVLARTWHVVADASCLAMKETAFPVTLLPGALDEPLVLTRDRKDRLHCLANSCTHRGELVCMAAGPAKLLQCAAHGRTFRLDGELMDAPGLQGAPGFPSPSDSLARLPVATWGPLVFASLAPAAPFEDVVGPLRGSCAPPLARGGMGRETAEIEANWALWVEASLASFVGEGVTLHEGGAVHAGPAVRAWLFPATFVDVAGETIAVSSAQPAAPGRTRVHRLSVGAGGAPSPDPWAVDGALLAGFQRGLRSRSYRPGHYAPARDRAVHHFHRLLGGAIAKP